jgi:threonine/homoserine/homoserine lactone efflux protein
MNSDSIVLKSLIAFAHPLLMLATLAGGFYALYLGLQVRRTRTADKEVKKELIKGKYNQRHFQLGSILLVLWVIGGIGGMAATYTLFHKLFVSPHLIIGLLSVGVVASAAAFAPLMQQGQEWARVTHIAIATTMIGLVLAQTYTGLQIVQKLLHDILGTA